MAGIIGDGVTLHGLYNQDLSFTWNISGAFDKKADMGKVMAQDKTAANTAKLAGDNDAIIGVIGSYENRLQEGIITGAIYHSGGFQVPFVGTVAIGDQVTGSATPGAVKKATAAVVGKLALVTEVNTTTGNCTILFV